MERRSALKARIASIEALLDVVRTMKSLAAVHMQQAEQSVVAARRYAEIVGTAFADALTLVDAAVRTVPSQPAGRRAVLLFCSEHGFVGALNDAVLGAAAEGVGEDDLVFIVGARGAGLAAERGLAIAGQWSMATHAAGVPGLARRISAEALSRAEAAGVAHLDMLHPRFAAAGERTIERVRLLPPDLERLSASMGPVPPLLNLSKQELVDRVSEEYFFAALTTAMMEALLSESAARFAAMSAAQENIERKLDDLQLQERQSRQEEITTELLDLVTGSEAALRT